MSDVRCSLRRWILSSAFLTSGFQGLAAGVVHHMGLEVDEHVGAAGTVRHHAPQRRASS